MGPCTTRPEGGRIVGDEDRGPSQTVLLITGHWLLNDGLPTTND
jgi:hypothetical protein